MVSAHGKLQASGPGHLDHPPMHPDWLSNMYGPIPVDICADCLEPMPNGSTFGEGECVHPAGWDWVQCLVNPALQ